MSRDIDDAANRGDAERTRAMRFFRFAAAVFLAASALHAEPSVAKGASFLRTADLPGGGRGLQTASTEFRPASGSGPSVWLIGVAHLGTAEYFQAIQQRLDRQTVVLYEGIGLHDLQRGPGGAREDAGIQSKLADALGLKFQLDAIDYRRPSFVNSDLHVPELQEEMKQRVPDAADPAGGDTFDQLLGALQGTGAMGGALTQMITLLGATPQMRETTRLMLVEVLGQAGDLLGIAQQASPEMRELFDVLLKQRNDVVVRDLRAQLAKRKAGESVAIFYGAAHMDEIAQRLRDELGYAPATTEWETAFGADPAASGINPAQVRMMIEMMRSQFPPRAPR